MRKDYLIREIRPADLHGLLKLYMHLHETGVPEDNGHLRHMWDEILADPHYHIVVCETEEQIVSSCVCVIVPNLTRGVRPYALIENVVTHADFRGRGYATACLNYAKEIAGQSDCYKMMLITGAKSESTLDFYRNAGYSSEGKTAFYQLLDGNIVF